MEIIWINVGYGDSMLVLCDGMTVLLDGGSAREEEFAGPRIRAADYLRRRNIRKIDLLVVSHIHEDHVCGLERVLDECEVGRVVANCLPPPAFACAAGPDSPPSVGLFSEALRCFQRMVARCETLKIPVQLLGRGDRLSLGEQCSLECIGPSADVQQGFAATLAQAAAAPDPTSLLTELDRLSNDASLLLALHSPWGDILLTADNCPANWPGDDCFLPENVTVLKLPHHAQPDSFSAAVMARMPLQYVVTCASSDRRYGSASPQVYQPLAQMHPQARMLFTDERDYPPYFHAPGSHSAIHMLFDSDGIHTEFEK